MKRILLTILSVMAFAGMSVAQDVYTAGYFENSYGYHTAAVYINGSLLFHVTPSDYHITESTGVVWHDGHVYWAIDEKWNDGEYYCTSVMKDEEIYFNTFPTREGPHISAMFHGNNVFAVGSQEFEINGFTRTACLWKNDDPIPYYILGDGEFTSEATCGMVGPESYVYTGGWQATNGDVHGVVWKGGSEYFRLPNGTMIYGIAYYNNKIYTVGTHQEGGILKAMIWEDTNVYCTLSTVSSTGRLSIYVDNGDIYATGCDGGVDRVWKNGVPLYSSSYDEFTCVTANSSGVYYAGSDNDGMIWKDGASLYAPSSCEYINAIYVDEPECDNSDARRLPFFDGFENGETSWPCWTQVDVDEENGTFATYWHRAGMHPFSNYFSPATGEHCAYHYHGDNQVGWLISPKLFLQPGRDRTTLTFKSCQPRPGFYSSGGCSVWISTTGTSLFDFTKIWEESSPSLEWSTKTIDLKAYQGQAVYIAFRYMSETYEDHCWLIDDVSVVEDWTPCSVQQVPFRETFTDYIWGCWYIYDGDRSGDNRCWQHDDAFNCAYHPYGQSDAPQYGCLISPTIDLPAGGDYVLKFVTNSIVSGPDMANKVWLCLDPPSIPSPYYHDIFLWEDTEFANAWVSVEIPLSEYAGHTISLSFEYQGTFAHNWFIDDVTVTRKTGVEEGEATALTVCPNPAKESIRITGLETESEVQIYNSLGELVKTANVNPNQEIGIGELASGLYLVRCGNATMRFVKE